MSGTETRVRERMLNVRLDDSEYAAIESAAERAGLAVSSYARETLLGAPAPRQVRRPPIERKELVRLLGEVGKIGSNLNQLARAKNSGELVYDADLDSVISGVLDVRAAILKALGREP